MTFKKHAGNERAKLEYFGFMRQADGKSVSTIRQSEKALLRFEEFTRGKDFRQFDQHVAVAFKSSVAALPLSPATILITMTNVKRFFCWLAQRPGYKRHISSYDIEYLNLSDKDIKAARAPADREYPSLLMVERAVAAMKFETSIELRDRAMIALAAVTNIRVSALITLKLKHFHPDRMLVLQDPREVSTKFSKRINSFLIPLNEEFERIVLEWHTFLRNELLFADNDPLFPKTALTHDENDCFVASGLTREHWADGSSARAIFKAAFEAAGLPPFTPHSFRHMLVSEAYRRKLPPNELKAWSQNLGHESLMTTLISYGKLSLEEQGELVRKGSDPQRGEQLTMATLEEVLRKRGL